MRIKRIDLIGFKSFCDKTTVELTDQLVGIVGPNGCGKSNIVDALRWAMGEQSARHLRGKAMADVIFNGSDSRGPSGSAEIAITFENDGRVPIEYASYTEITVTRRLHRDGTSEYLINKVPVRLRDVTNLFLGTGAGTKAYSIIEQGRVGLIVSAKPEDRRLFIEEAAGITKYRRRKDAAERKMESTRQNLLRVSDILEELGKRLGSLRRQAKKAERYREYSQEMNEIELWSASHKWLGIVAEQKTVESQIAELETLKCDSEREVERSETSIDAIRLEAADLEQTVQSRQESIYQLENKIKLTESEAEFEKREADELERRAEQSGGEIEQLEVQHEELIAELDASKKEADEFHARRDELAEALREQESAFAAVDSALSELNGEIEQERDRASDAERTQDREQTHLSSLSQRADDLNARKTELENEQRTLFDRQAEINGSLSQLTGELDGFRASLSDLVGRRKELENRQIELEESIDHGDAEIEVLRTELHRRKSRLGSLKEIQARYEGFGQGTREIMQRHNGHSNERGILGLVAEAVEAPQRYEVALEAVLGRRLETVIVSDTETGKDAVAYLKQNRKGRSSFIASNAPQAQALADAPVGFVWNPPAAESVSYDGNGMQISASSTAPAGVLGPMLDLVKCESTHKPIAERLLRDVYVVEDLDRALSVWDQAPEKTWVTLEGEILEPDGTLTGGAGDVEGGSVLKQRREIKELSDIIVDLEQQYDSRMESHVALKTEAATVKQMLFALTDEGHQNDKEALTREKDIGGMRSELEKIGSRLEQIAKQIEDASEMSQRNIQEQQQSREALELAIETCELANAALAELSEKRAGLVAEVATAQSAVTDAKVSLAQLETSCDGIEDRVARLTTQRDDRAERISRLSDESVSGRSRAKSLRESAEQKISTLGEMVESVGKQRDELSEARNEYEAKVVRISEEEVALKEIRQLSAEYAGTLGRQQIRLSELTLMQQHVEEQVVEKTREEIRSVVSDYHMRPPVSANELKRLAELKDLIKRMGEINLTAIDEFQELNTRFEFLTTQREDLEGALQQLQRAIQKINRTCRQRFKETFELVNTHFQQVFPRLFNGGRAKLVLTESEDVLEGGVDIFAQPPGKKLQSLEMMSGGEKALTAVSMIFAMFIVKPTPFCLLDEVDAPLDDANVIRFRELIRELSNTCQFIVITHNRSTMEAVDRLYGVTMEEPGISRMVSVNLKQAQAVTTM